MTSESSGERSPARPKFRGCVFCYAGEWAYYGAKKALGSATDGHSAQ